MALQVQIWIKSIIEGLFADNSFASRSIDHSEFVNNKTVHVPNAGSAPGVVKNRNVFPAQVTTREDVDLEYGMDESSGYWFHRAWGNLQQLDLQRGDVHGFHADVLTLAELSQREGVIWDHLPFYEKYKHEILSSISIALALTAMITAPHASPWVIRTLLVADIGVAATDAYLYWKDGDTQAALLAAGFILVPIAIGGILKWVRMTTDELSGIQTGQSMVKNGDVITTTNLEQGKILAEQARIEDKVQDVGRVIKDHDAPVVTGPNRGVVDEDLFYGSVDQFGDATLTPESVRSITDMSTINPDSDFVVLGKWVKDSPSSYEQVGHRAGTTYFDTGTAFEGIQEQLQLHPYDLMDSEVAAEMWGINRQFLDDQMSQHKTFIYTADPRNLGRETYGGMEYRHIIASGKYHLESIDGTYYLKEG